jgi:hypothetical protein
MVDAADRQPYDAHHTAGACRQRALALFLLATLSECSAPNSGSVRCTMNLVLILMQLLLPQPLFVDVDTNRPGVCCLTFYLLFFLKLANSLTPVSTAHSIVPGEPVRRVFPSTCSVFKARNAGSYR